MLFSWIFFPGKFYLREILRGCRQATILLAWKGTQGIDAGGGGSTTTVADLVSPRRRSDSAYVVAICTCTDGKGAFMSWLVKSTGVGCVKTSWCYFPGFFFPGKFYLMEILRG